MDALKNKKILVTGAGGFIGSHVAETLLPLSGHVRAMIHYESRPEWGNLEFLPSDAKNQLEVVAGDITDPHCVQNAVEGCDIVLHLAALIAIPYSYKAPTSYFQTNVLGTLNILEACRRREIEKVVVTSTSETFGTARTVPMSEEHPLQAQSPYAASKIGADKAAESYYCSFDLPVVILRPFNTYGPRQSARAIIPTIISQVLADAPEIRLGSLTPVRDLTYVADTVQGFLRAAALSGGVGKSINLGVGEGVTIGDLVNLIQDILGTEKPVITEQERIRPEKSEVTRLISDNTQAKQLLGWEPRYSLREGLSETIAFVKNTPAFYKTGKYTY